MTSPGKLRFEDDDRDFSGQAADETVYFGKRTANEVGDSIRHSYSHRQQKRRMKESRAGNAAGSEYGSAERTGDTMERTSEAAKKIKNFAVKHRKGLIIFAVIAAVILIFLGMISTFSAVIEGAVSGLGITTFPSADSDMLVAEERYREMEQELRNTISNYQSTHQYNEYSYDIDDISHDPYELISAITAVKGGAWKTGEIGDILNSLFAAQYTLTETSASETRYTSELRQGVSYYTDFSTGNLVPYTYSYYENVPYQYTGCTVTLRNNGLGNALREILSDEQMKSFTAYMISLGNRPDLFTDTIYSGSVADSDDATFAAMMAEAEKYIGWPYVWGGSSPETSFDCSGYVCWVLNHSGWNIARTNAQGLYNLCAPISNTEVRPGDLVFFKGTYNTTQISHVGIYTGNGMMINAGDPIGFENLNSTYWRSHLYAYGRLPRP